MALGSSSGTMNSHTMSTKMVITTLALLFPSVLSHSWVEQAQLVVDGQFVGDYGYARGYVSRTDPAFTGFSNKWQLPSPEEGQTHINKDMMACHASQRTPNNSEQSPKLKAAPGAYVAMKYLENGHVSKPNVPEGKGEGSGAVYVFGTYSPSATEKLVDILHWNTEGTGGDKRGFLISAQNYDDGRCYQINDAPISVNRQSSFGNHPKDQPTVNLEQWCETDFQIPTSSKVGQLTTYWVWDWATSVNGQVTQDEYYTSCVDIDVVQDLSKIASASQVHTLGEQDPQTKAVANYKSRPAAQPTPRAEGQAKGGDNAAAEPTSSPSNGNSTPAEPTSSPSNGNSTPAEPTSSQAAEPTSAPAESAAPRPTETKIIFQTKTIPAPSEPAPTRAPGLAVVRKGQVGGAVRQIGKRAMTFSG